MKIVTAEAPKKLSPGETILAERLRAYRRGDIDPVQHGEDGAGFQGHVPLRIAGSFRGGATSINVNSAPLEFLYFSRLLATPDDGSSAESIRYDAACRVRKALEQAQVNGLRGQNFNDSGGAGQVRNRPISEQKAMRILELARLREGMPLRDLKLLEDVVFLDKWIWDGRTRKRRSQILEDFRKALDRAAVHYGRMSDREFTSRWRALRGAHRRRAGSSR
jgi:hypothetical protein